MSCSQEKAQTPQSGHKDVICLFAPQRFKMNKARNGALKTATRLGGILKKIKRQSHHQIEFLRQSWFRGREVIPLSILQSWRPNTEATSGAHNCLDIDVGLQLRACVQPHLPGALRTGSTSLWAQPVLQRDRTSPKSQMSADRLLLSQSSSAIVHPTARDSQAQVPDAATLSNYFYGKHQTTPRQTLKSLFAVQEHKQLPSYTRLWNL